MRDQLIELISRYDDLYDCGECDRYSGENCGCKCLADYLLENGVIVLPCNVGDRVYVTVNCSRIMKFYDNDYLTGTGAIECPFENVCKFIECNDENIQVLETCVSYLLCDDNGWSFGCEHINKNYNLDDIGKTVFSTKEEAEQKLKGGADNGKVY